MLQSVPVTPFPSPRLGKPSSLEHMPVPNADQTAQRRWCSFRWLTPQPAASSRLRSKTQAGSIAIVCGFVSWQHQLQLRNGTVVAGLVCAIVGGISDRLYRDMPNSELVEHGSLVCALQECRCKARTPMWVLRSSLAWQRALQRDK